MDVGPELGRGVRSVVYAFGSDEVVKIPNPGTPTAWLDEELRIADSAARAGAPLPARRRRILLDGRIALVSERIVGPTMWDLLRDEPDSAADLGVQLAGLHVRLWSCAPSYELPSQRDRIVSKIHAVAAMHGAEVLRVLDRLPDEDGPLVLCHGDLHPHNVLLSPNGPVLVDWFDASRGAAAADVARTDVMLRSSRDLDPTGEGRLREAVDGLRRSYRSAVDGTGIITPDQIDAWSAVQQVARVAEGFGVDRLADLLAEIV